MVMSSVPHEFVPAFEGLRRSFATDPVIRYFVAILLTANLALILIHIVIGASYRLGLQPNALPYLWNVSSDHGVPEFLNYLQTGLCIVFLLVGWFRVRIHARLAWALVFVVVLADDSLEYHETVGNYLSTVLQLPTLVGAEADEIGEIISWLIAAAIVALPMLAALRQKQSRTDPLSKLLLASFASLVFFAVGMDFIHQLMSGSSAGRVLGAIEDGGEMLSLAFACSCSFVFFRRRQ